jgi:anaerobic ribonucleoside-triphosphate reductase activating protein
MSILIPVYSTGVTMNEIPDHLAFYIEMGNCKKKCKGCHSPHLWNTVDNPMSIEELEVLAYDAIAKGANAIVLMGGTTNDIPYPHLVRLIDKLSQIAPVCLYSGSDDYEHDMLIAITTRLTWLKTGSYQETKGGLMSAETNQKFLRKENVRLNYTVFVDETYKFKI